MNERVKEQPQNTVGLGVQQGKPSKPRKSIKPQAVKTAVILGRTNGKAKSHIARDLGISRPTVDAIIEESQIDKQLEVGHISCVRLIPEAVDAIGFQLKKGDGELGRKFLNDMGVIGQSAGKPSVEMLHLTQAVSIMFKPQQVTEQKTIEMKVEPIADVVS